MQGLKCLFGFHSLGLIPFPLILYSLYLAIHSAVGIKVSIWVEGYVGWMDDACAGVLRDLWLLCPRLLSELRSDGRRGWVAGFSKDMLDLETAWDYRRLRPHGSP